MKLRLPSLGLALLTALSVTDISKPTPRPTTASFSTSTSISTIAKAAEYLNPNEELNSYPTAFFHGKPIYTTPSLTKLASEAAKAYHQIQQHWHNAEAQFSRVTSLSFYPIHPYHAGEADMNNGNVYFYGSHKVVNGNAAGPLECQYGLDGIFVHELAHVWHGFLLPEDRKAFEQQWREIAQDSYDPDACDASRLHLPAYEMNCRISAKQAGAVTAYGGKSLEEDVAELVTLAYQVQKCPPGQRLPNNHTIIPENRDRIIQKLGLLNEYGFIGEGAMEKAMGEVEKVVGEVKEVEKVQ